MSNEPMQRCFRILLTPFLVGSDILLLEETPYCKMNGGVLVS